MYDGTGNTELLTDTKNDPLETINYAYKKSAKKEKARLSKQLSNWMQERNLKFDPTVTRLPKEVKKK
jgi:hypothetical protein